MHPTKKRLRDIYKTDKDWRARYKNRFSRRDKSKEDELSESKGITFATIVEKISVDHSPKCKKHQGKLEVRDNLIIVPNFGRIYFGELIITDFYKRLSGVRLELGSPMKASIEGAGVESNGSGAD